MRRGELAPAHDDSVVDSQLLGHAPRINRGEFRPSRRVSGASETRMVADRYPRRPLIARRQTPHESTIALSPETRSPEKLEAGRVPRCRPEFRHELGSPARARVRRRYVQQRFFDITPHHTAAEHKVDEASPRSFECKSHQAGQPRIAKPIRDAKREHRVIVRRCPGHQLGVREAPRREVHLVGLVEQLRSTVERGAGQGFHGHNNVERLQPRLQIAGR